MYAQLVADVLHGLGRQQLLTGGNAHLGESVGVVGQPAAEGVGTHAGRHGNLVLESCFHTLGFMVYGLWMRV